VKWSARLCGSEFAGGWLHCPHTCDAKATTIAITGSNSWAGQRRKKRTYRYVGCRHYL